MLFLTTVLMHLVCMEKVVQNRRRQLLQQSQGPTLPKFLAMTMMLILTTTPAVVVVARRRTDEKNEASSLLMDDSTSSRNRELVSSLSKLSTSPPEDKIVLKRQSFPNGNQSAAALPPHICLAFLSCCDRIDLLNHTIHGAIRHMEEDEPSFLRYEIAWVDNGSSQHLTDEIKDSYEIEHVLTLRENQGLAYGMNLLIQNLCTAPYILLLEEDWLYLDDIVAKQTPQRRRVVSTAIALIENLRHNNITAFDGRNIMGVFLRHESYESFLSFPYADIWEEQSNVDLQDELERSVVEGGVGSGSCSSSMVSDEFDGGCKNDQFDDDDSFIVDIDYRVFCADVGLKSEALWGSYTNGKCDDACTGTYVCLCTQCLVERALFSIQIILHLTVLYRSWVVQSQRSNY